MRFWTISESVHFWPERRGDDGFKEALSSFVTVCRMGAERVCVEANRRLEADVVDRLDDAAEELGEFFAQLSAGEKTMHDIERTGVFQICRGMATSEGVS